MDYPSKREILTNLYTPTGEEVETVQQWKKDYYLKKWSTLSETDKIKALKDLTQGLVSPSIKIHYDINADKWYVSLKEMTQEATMGMGLLNVSIISCLHEIGHIRYGSDELKACTFSTGIFSTCFPKEFSKLKWKGHLLKKA